MFCSPFVWIKFLAGHSYSFRARSNGVIIVWLCAIDNEYKAKMIPKHDSIRGWFAASLYEAMEQDDRIWLITADLGYLMLDSIKEDFPQRFLNVGASECCMIGIGVGLALEGQIPFCYSITSFLLYRPFEWHRNFLQHEGIPVRLVGSGFEDDYKHDGITHQTYDAFDVLKLFPRIQTYLPSAKEQVPVAVRAMIEHNEPSFICLRR